MANTFAILVDRWGENLRSLRKTRGRIFVHGSEQVAYVRKEMRERVEFTRKMVSDKRPVSSVSNLVCP